MKAIFLIFLTVLTLASFPAFALDLAQARSGGLVGEQLDGYVAVIGSNAEAQGLVSSVNAKRREEYAKISAQNGQPVSIVGKVASEQIINGLPSGSYFQSSDGSWKQK